MDYARPDGRTLTVAISRIRGTDTAHRAARCCSTAAAPAARPSAIRPSCAAPCARWPPATTWWASTPASSAAAPRWTATGPPAA
ncbi:hypothetical protein ACFQ3Z_41445 [Streptomyces nogalater]